MSGSEIKIKRRDIMTARGVADLLRRLADQIEKQHSFTIDGLPVMMANQVSVRQEYKKDGFEHIYRLTLSWDEELVDQAKIDGNRNQTTADEDALDLPETEDVPTTPIDLPGPEDQPGIRSGDEADRS
jgi:hypothetical protein